MPIYEYRCRACEVRSSFFTKSMSDRVDPICPECGSSDMLRAMSSFAHRKSLQSVHAESGPGTPSLDYYSDPRNVGRHLEESFQRYGVDMPQSVKDNIDAARDGELPKGLDL